MGEKLYSIEGPPQDWTPSVLKPTVLVIGCGMKQRPEGYGLKRANGDPVDLDTLTWITLDMNPDVLPDHVCEIGKDPIPLKDNSVDLIIAMHVLEHVGTQGETDAWFYAWGELYRVLKPGGRVQFECPLATSVWAWADPTHTRGITEYSFLYLNQDAYRREGSAIPRYRVPADFVVVQFTRIPDHTNADVRKLESESFLNGILEARKPFAPYWDDASITR